MAIRQRDRQEEKGRHRKKKDVKEERLAETEIGKRAVERVMQGYRRDITYTGTVVIVWLFTARTQPLLSNEAPVALR